MSTRLEAQMVELLRKHGPQTTAELAARTGLSRSSVANVMSWAAARDVVSDGTAWSAQYPPDSGPALVLYATRPPGRITWYLLDFDTDWINYREDAPPMTEQLGPR